MDSGLYFLERDLPVGLTVCHIRGVADWMPKEVVKAANVARSLGNGSIVITLGAPRPKGDGPVIAIDAALLSGIVEVIQTMVGRRPHFVGLLGLGNILIDGEDTEESFAGYITRTRRVMRTINDAAREQGTVVLACTNPPYSWRCPDWVNCFTPKKLKRWRKETQGGKH